MHSVKVCLSQLDILRQKFASHGEIYLRPEIMPHGRGIVKAYRHRRVVQRRQQIGPDIMNFGCGLFQRVDDVLNMASVQLQEPFLDGPCGEHCPADPHSG